MAFQDQAYQKNRSTAVTVLRKPRIRPKSVVLSLKDQDIHRVVAILKQEIKRWRVPIVGVVAEESNDPFRVLISCLLSLRTQDRTTELASRRLFELAVTPEEMLKLSIPRIEKAIYPVGFYRTKARTIKSICQALISQYQSRVPDEIDELLKLKGVGRKTANLVVTLLS